MNKINLQHAVWADLWNEIGSISPDYDGILLRARQLVKEGRPGPTRGQVVAHLGSKMVGLGEVA